MRDICNTSCIQRGRWRDLSSNIACLHSFAINSAAASRLWGAPAAAFALAGMQQQQQSLLLVLLNIQVAGIAARVETHGILATCCAPFPYFLRAVRSLAMFLRLTGSCSGSCRAIFPFVASVPAEMFLIWEHSASCPKSGTYTSACICIDGQFELQCYVFLRIRTDEDCTNVRTARGRCPRRRCARSSAFGFQRPGARLVTSSLFSLEPLCL